MAAGGPDGGADGLFAVHFAEERQPLRKGDRMAGEFVLEFVGR